MSIKAKKLSDLAAVSLPINDIEDYALELSDGEVVVFPNPIMGRNFDEYSLVLDTLLDLLRTSLQYIDLNKAVSDPSTITENLDLNILREFLNQINVARINAILESWAGADKIADIKRVDGLPLPKMLALFSDLIQHYAGALLRVGELGKGNGSH